MANNILDWYGNLGSLFSTPTPQETSIPADTGSSSFMDMLGNLGTGIGNLFGNVNLGSAIPAIGGALGTYRNYQETQDLGKELARNLQFTPYNVTTTTGTARFDPSAKTATSTLSPALQQMYDTILGKAQAGAGGITLKPEEATQGALGLLRQLGAPEEQRRTTELENRLLAQGRLGSTGGAQEQQAFQQALSQADLARQLQAIGLGQETINNLIRNTTGLLGTAQTLGQTPQSLLGLGAGLGGQAMAGEQAAADIQYRTSQAAQDLRNLFLSGLLGNVGGAGGGGLLGGLFGGGTTPQQQASSPLGSLGSTLLNWGISSGIDYLGGLLGGGAGTTAGAGATLAPELFSGLSGLTGVSSTSAALAPNLFTGLPEATGLTGTGLPFGSFGTGSSLAAGGAGAGTAAGGLFGMLPTIAPYASPTMTSMLPLPWEGAAPTSAGAEGLLSGIGGPLAGLAFVAAGPQIANFIDSVTGFSDDDPRFNEFERIIAPIAEKYFTPEGIQDVQQKLASRIGKPPIASRELFPDLYDKFISASESVGLGKLNGMFWFNQYLSRYAPKEYMALNPWNTQEGITPDTFTGG